jgi:hypothetical protein
LISGASTGGVLGSPDGMSILGRLMGTAENTARTAARGGRTGRGMPRSTGRMSTGRGYGRATTGRAGRGRATPAASGLGGLIGGLLRRR